MYKDAYEGSQRTENSYFDREEEKKITMLKSEVFIKVFEALYCLTKEEIASTKFASLLDLIEKICVDDLKYFQTRSEPVYPKMLLLIAKTIIQGIVVKIKRSDIYLLLTDELPIYLAFVNLFHLLNTTIITKRKWRQFLLTVQIF